MHFRAIWEEEVIKDIKSILRVTAHWMAIPLFLLFWIADILYIPQMKWEFLLIRVLIIPICFLVTSLSQRTKTYRSLQVVASLYAIALASGINLMIFMTGSSGTGYYAGLNLVAMGCLSFIPFSRRFYLVTTLGIFAPYFAIVLTRANGISDYQAVAINSFFIVSTICMCFLIRIFHEDLRLKEIRARFQLKQELENREEIIRVKTNEAVRLNALSSQFSPQLVESIRNGKVRIDQGGKRAQICAIFIDIVNSTERITKIDKDKVDKVLSKFLDDTIRILLKFDITIDKFLGDGILGFCNAPMERAGYPGRVASAALEVKEKIQLDREFYKAIWQKEFEIRIGIAKGYANVGFYGSQKYYRNYTAIGPVVNMAARLCSSANPSQILADASVFEDIQNDFDVKFLDKRSLKGFDDQAVFTYELRGTRSNSVLIPAGQSDCPVCGSMLSLETNEKGQFVFMCRSCCSIVEDVVVPKDSQKEPA